MLRKFAALIGFIGLALVVVPAFAQNCEVTIDSTDQMRYDTDLVEISKSCTEFTVHLTHSGQLPKQAMGHNWVLTTANDMQGVVADAVAAGLDNDYLPPNDKRVIAHTRLIGGGEKDSVTFPVSALQANEQYVFFCSFPGHSAVMNGKVVLVD
ncbi:MAG: azurin [Xanthomonadaceae bacterium]|nr:azurin [Xanthomonadaceae bacterium]